MEDHRRVTSSTAPVPPHAPAAASPRRGLALIGTAIVLTGLNLRTAVTSIGPVLHELEQGLHISSGLAGLVTTMPVICFAAIGFAGPGLSARFRDSHVLSGALVAMAAGLVVRAVAPSIALFLAGTVLAMVGGALGNVLLPSLVKRYFPDRTGLMVGAYSTAMSIGATVGAVSTAPIASSAGANGWRWALGVWAIFALIAAIPWLVVPAHPGASRGSHTAVRMRDLRHSRMALALMLFFGIQGMEAYIVIGWSAQYLRDMGLSAAAAGLLLGLNQLIGIPLSALVPTLTVRHRVQRPLLLTFMACYALGWIGLWMAPTAVPWLWMTLLSIAMASFPMLLTLIGLRARTPETTAALSTYVQGWGYVISAVGPLLVGVLLGATGSYAGMFVLVLAGTVVLSVTGWLMTRERYADDEVNRFVPGWSSAGHSTEVLECVGGEPPVAVHVRDADDASLRG
jgi:CP family cyanate transporter-like MFS transporter